MTGDPYDADDPGWDDPEPDRIRGWIPPDDRQWRHPSELGSGRQEHLPVVAVPSVRRGRVGPWTALGTCTLFALLVTGVVIMSTAYASHRDLDQPTSSSLAVGSTPTTEPGSGLLASHIDTGRLVSSLRPSLVALVVTGRSGTTWSTGVVAESGGIVATTASALAGATSVSSIDPTGQRQPASLVGIDRTSGIAVLRISDDLPVAQFDDGDLAAGAPAVAVALEPGGQHATPVPTVYAGTVRSSGTAVDTGPVTTTFVATTVSVPLDKRDVGCALLDAQGGVDGILQTTMPGNGQELSVFLPSELVLGVTRQLVATGAVTRGWMGIDASDAPTATVGGAVAASRPQDSGAVVDSVVTGGAAWAAGLQPGDVIVALDGQPVRSTAELRTRLYADGAGAVLQVTARRSTGTVVTTLMATGSADGISTTAAPG